MNYKTLLFVMPFLLMAYCSYAQGANYEMSNPIEFKQTGWNKVLCMKNGNTFLFHLDPTRPVEIKVFDSLHKRIANQEHVCSVLDISTLRTSEFKGLFDINGEAVLFIEQEHLGRFGLVRLRFDGKNGKLLEEKLVKESPGISKRTKFYVMKNRGEDNYAILYSTDVPQFYDCEIHITYYNNRHDVLKEIPLDVDRKKYDYLYVACAEARPNGICVVLDLKKLVENMTTSRESAQRDVYNHHEAIYYIPKDSSKAYKQVVDVSTDVTPDYSEVTYNLFAKTVNLLVFSYRELFYKFGIDVKRGTALGNMFFKIEEDNSDIKMNWVKNDIATAALQKSADTSKVFLGVPLGMYTNSNGLTTLVSESYDRYDEPESGVAAAPRDPNYAGQTRYVRGRPVNRNIPDRASANSVRYDWNTYFGNIGITQLDDDGNEIWGTVLPHSEYLKSYKHYYRPEEIAKKDQSHKLFDDLPDQVTQRQFVSLNSYFHNNNLYIVFNDDQLNYQNIKNADRDTVFNFEQTNAFYYKMNSKKEITRSYLLGEPAKNEYKCSFIEGADFDEQRGVYATLVQYKRNDNTSLRMAWSHLN